MQSFAINYLALLVAAVVKFVIGFAWYSPPVFGKTWQGLVGVKRDPATIKSIMIRGMVVDFIGGLIMAYILVHSVHYAGAVSIGQGAAVGFFNWLGYIGVTTLSGIVWEGRPFKYWLISNGYLLLSLLIMGAIVAVWV